MEMEELQTFLKALASETRQKILLQFMGNHELTVNQIAEKIGVGQSTASEHLAILKSAGIVMARKEGRTVYYYPNKQKVLKLLEQLNDYITSCC